MAGPPPIPEDLRRAARTMLLPLAADLEDAAIAALSGEIATYGVPVGDQAIWIRLSLEDWRDAKAPSAHLRGAVRAALLTGAPELGAAFARSYFLVHQRLRAEGYTHDEATAFLGHARLVFRLAAAERMSASQVAKILSARDARVPFAWKSVQVVLERLRVRPRLELARVQALFASDRVLEEVVFADADEETSAALVSEVGQRLGFQGDLASLLVDLVPPDVHGPYLQILHYLCVIEEFYDHAMPYLYEFAPRGAVANWLFGQYPPALTGAGNPVLNNAKAQERVDDAWARSRKRSEARALVEITTGAESMTFEARRELAGWLRLWLMRQIRLRMGVAVVLPAAPTAPQVSNVLAAVAAGNTATAGVIEQRVVDALTAELHAEADGWRARGLGDSVNAANVSRRKLGDTDFQNAATMRVVTYETHSGVLTPLYVAEHERTLRKVLVARKEEWKGISDPALWQIEVHFVAHGFNPPMANEVKAIDGTQVTYIFETFAQLAARAPTVAALVAPFAARVHAILNEQRTPDRVRQVYEGIM